MTQNKRFRPIETAVRATHAALSDFRQAVMVGVVPMASHRLVSAASEHTPNMAVWLAAFGHAATEYVPHLVVGVALAVGAAMYRSCANRRKRDGGTPSLQFLFADGSAAEGVTIRNSIGSKELKTDKHGMLTEPELPRHWTLDGVVLHCFHSGRAWRVVVHLDARGCPVPITLQ
jgi:hypothetical protein